MLTNEDIQKLTSVLASKDDIKVVASDIADLRELVQGLVVASDNLMKAITNLGLEYSAISEQISRHDKWIKQIAEKVGLTLREI